MSDSAVNRPSLASRLPPDIIFIIARLVFPDPKIKRSASYGYDFVDLTRVCRGWRNALLSYHTFWTKIEVPSRNLWFLEQVLLRSADHPIDAIIRIGDRTKKVLPRSLEITFSHLHHIQTLTFCETSGYTPDLDYIFHLLDNKPAPALKVFSFDLQFESPWISSRGSIPKNVLVNMAPNLEELKIAFMTISHQMPIFKSITRLHLKYVWGITSVHQLFDMLEATSHLEVLELDSLRGLPLDFDVQDLNDRSVQFSALQSLSLNLEPEILMTVLDHTTLPSEIDWKIDCHDVLCQSAIDIDPLLSFVSRTRNGTCLTLKNNCADLQMDFAQNPSGPYNISIKMKLLGNEICMHRLHFMFVNFGLSKVYFCDILFPSRTRDIPGWLEKYETTFDSLFSLFNHLEKLVIACEEPSVLLQFLSELLPDEEYTTVPCPLLSDLKVGVVSTTGKTLARILTHRKKAGSVLTNLCVEYSHSERSIREIKPVFEELVENVEIASVSLSVMDNMSFLTVSGGRMYDRPMNSVSRLSYTARYSDVDRYTF